MNLKNKIRNVFNIRVDRNLPPPGPKPQIGSSIVRERLRIKLKYAISNEQWQWFIQQGWRTVDMRTERRSYTNVPDKLLERLLELDDVQRDVLHQKIILKVAGDTTIGFEVPRKRELHLNRTE